MLNIIIIAVLVLGLVLHRYLTAFWENGLLPYPSAFLILVPIFLLGLLANCIWIFGALVGGILFALALFQQLHGGILWIFSLPDLLKMRKNPTTLPRVNVLAYNGFLFVALGLGILAIANFFVSDYRSAWDYLVYQDAAWTTVSVFAVIMLVGNIARLSILLPLKKHGLYGERRPVRG